MGSYQPGNQGSRFGGQGQGPDPTVIINFIQKRALMFIVAALILVAAATSYYQIDPEEIGLVTRLGKYVTTAEPGLHYKLPFSIDQVIHVPVQRQLKAEFGFRTVRASVRTEYSSEEDAQREAAMLTGDLNVAQVEWIVQYQIREPRKYVFNVRNADDTLRDMAEATMRRVVGDHSVTEVLTVGRERVQQQTKLALQKLCDRYEIGIEILQLVLQDVNPPAPVRESFNEVNQAIQDRERAVNQAWARYNSVIPEARGKAQQALESAEGYATERVNQAKGDVQRFLALQGEYQKAPVVTRSRIYLETMGKVLPRAQKRTIIDQDVKGLLPMLNLNSARTAQ